MDALMTLGGVTSRDVTAVYSAMRNYTSDMEDRFLFKAVTKWKRHPYVSHDFRRLAETHTNAPMCYSGAQSPTLDATQAPESARRLAEERINTIEARPKVETQSSGAPDVRRLAEEHIDAPIFFCGWFVLLFVFAIVYVYERRVAKRKRPTMHERCRSHQTLSQKSWTGY